MHDTGEVRNISFTKLKALLSFQLDAMVRARNAYQNWHAAVHGDVTQLLPLRQENLKAFCADLAKAGYAPNTIIQLYLAGLCTWVSCFPFLAFSKHVLLPYSYLLPLTCLQSTLKITIVLYSEIPIASFETRLSINLSLQHRLITIFIFISANGQQFAIAKTGVSCLGYDSEGLFEKVRGHWYSHEEGGPVPAGCLTLDRHLRDWHAPAATAWAKFHFLVFLSKDMIIVIVLQAHNRNTEKALALFHPSCSLWPNCPLFYTISVSVCPKPHIFSIFKS